MELAQRYDDSPEGGNDGSKGLVVAARTRLGEVLQQRGEPRQALGEFHQAAAIDEQIASEAPFMLGVRRELWELHRQIGLVLSQTGDLDAALRSYRQALSHAEYLHSDNADNADWTAGLATAHLDIGDALARMRRFSQAIEEYQTGRSLAAGVAATTPGVRPLIEKFDTGLAAAKAGESAPAP